MITSPADHTTAEVAPIAIGTAPPRHDDARDELPRCSPAAPRIVWKIAAPMIGLGGFLLVLAVFAAWNVHEQQQTSSELVVREVRGMLAIDELHMAMREIRHQANMFLRTHDPANLRNVAKLHEETDELLGRAQHLARTESEQQLIGVVALGYQAFFEEFQAISASLFASSGARASGESRSDTLVTVTQEQAQALSHLSDDVLTNRVLEPLQECLAANKLVVERTNAASDATAQHLKVGFLLLGMCGGVAGLLMGTAVARAVGRSIVQLNISVRGVAGRLADVTGPVTFSHTGDLAGIESGLRTLEGDIAEVVERLQQREMELLRAEQLARVGQLAAGMAHELRNPLMPMKMLVQAALTRGDGSGLQGRSLQVINDEIGRLESSIQSLLDFARPPTPEKTTVDVKEVVISSLDLLAGRAKQQKVGIRPRLPQKPVMARVDRTQIRQLLINLLLNALDALPEGGLIDMVVETRLLPTESSSMPRTMPPTCNGDLITEHDALRLLGERHGMGEKNCSAWVFVSIGDNGPGIPPELLFDIFEPFVTTKETGTGLGLSICQRIASVHEGKLTVRNRRDGGAEFTLALPCAS